MNPYLANIIFFVIGFVAIFFSVMAARTREQNHFIVGAIATGIVILIALFKWDLVYFMIMTRDVFSLLVFGACIIIPIIFLVKTQQTKVNNSFDGSEANGPVTEEYLDEVINAPDEDIDFDKDYDLR